MIGTAVLIGFSGMFALDEAVKIFGHEAHEAEKTISGQATDKKSGRGKESQSALMTTIALCIHSLTEGVANGASLYSKSIRF